MSETKPHKKTEFEVEDTLIIPQSRDQVWRDLNNPVILAACIRGCERVERECETEFRAVIAARMGNLRREFRVALSVRDAEAPVRYTLVSGMRAGVFGKAVGTAAVTLGETDANIDFDFAPRLKAGLDADSGAKVRTRLHYRAVIGLEGVLRSFAPLVEPLAKKRVREFFSEFERHIGAC